MARQQIKIEISDGAMNFEMKGFGKGCDKESKFLESLGIVTGSKRDEKEYSKEAEKEKLKQKEY